MINQGLPEGGSWSGIPAGLTAGMQGEGAEVVHVDASVPREGGLERVLRMSWTDRAASRSFAVAGSYLARRGVRQAASLDGAVMIGSGYALGGVVPYVTFDDGTVAQALDLLGLGEVLSERVAIAWRRRQAKVYRDAFGCCLASEWAAASVRDDYGIDPAKVHVVGFGVNLAETPKVERDWSKPRFLFGIAYLDAAQAGIPSIGTTVGGAADAIGKGGRLVDPTDPQALVTAMLELSQPELARQLGNCARQRVKDFTWQAVARRVLGVLLSEPAAQRP